MLEPCLLQPCFHVAGERKGCFGKGGLDVLCLRFAHLVHTGVCEKNTPQERKTLRKTLRYISIYLSISLSRSMYIYIYIYIYAYTCGYSVALLVLSRRIREKNIETLMAVHTATCGDALDRITGYTCCVKNRHQIACVHICMCICMYVYIYIYMYVCMYVCMYVYVYIYIYIYTCICISLSLYVYICICICVYEYIYIYIHIHIHKHICARCSTQYVACHASSAYPSGFSAV